ncbi:cytochrome bd-type quinol oxidase subunit 2 [Kitasatospora sp. MAA19]|uniref:hypothetical protein n=1 Tax=Kitasatospora sp. MAA19 TaxID=3035090 RepID=UPI002472EC2D|nr:hypothetical protein [Kitasatospora sp. MAA19]MDH6704050.1 cytochrome bd-type quinol oxidase subunit 2 [Kitasatospora sp. MAA19]
MDTNTYSAPEAALLHDSRTRQAFGTVRNSITVYGALGGAALLAVVAVAVDGHLVNTFMWVRAVLLPVVAVLVHRLAGSAARGSRRAFERLSALTLIMPIAIVGVDLIPGVCPRWYAAIQVVCMLPVVRAAFAVRGSALRAAFPKAR